MQKCEQYSVIVAAIAAGIFLATGLVPDDVSAYNESPMLSKMVQAGQIPRSTKGCRYRPP